MFIATLFDVLQTGSTALHFAAGNGHLKTVEFLQSVGATDHPNKVQWNLFIRDTFVQRALSLIRRLSIIIKEVL